MEQIIRIGYSCSHSISVIKNSLNSIYFQFCYTIWCTVVVMWCILVVSPVHIASCSSELYSSPPQFQCFNYVAFYFADNRSLLILSNIFNNFRLFIIAHKLTMSFSKFFKSQYLSYSFPEWRRWAAIVNMGVVPLKPAFVLVIPYSLRVIHGAELRNLRYAHPQKRMQESVSSRCSVGSIER